MKRRPGRLRIIGGAWRSRLIDVQGGAELRPTPDRVRQTLFDWLALRIEGATALDLFAGSGALGLEALSRGAAHVTFVEREAGAADAIRAAVARFGAQDRAEVIHGDALRFLQALAGARSFELVFLDPPYGSGLLEAALPLVPRVLAPEHRVYLEWPGQEAPALPAGWSLLKTKRAGRVSYGLATRSDQGADP
ncbi:MAG: 16S rRNA (guanine(966)-N(2))-methyltransferase RsmD [Nevskia sp.]|nr:16S rRNA (guanine(966)-N(2))-methyltransferase RsmD [Nevskia sp.]